MTLIQLKNIIENTWVLTNTEKQELAIWLLQQVEADLPVKETYRAYNLSSGSPKLGCFHEGDFIQAVRCPAVKDGAEVAIEKDTPLSLWIVATGRHPTSSSKWLARIVGKVQFMAVRGKPGPVAIARAEDPTEDWYDDQIVILPQQCLLRVQHSASHPPYYLVFNEDGVRRYSLDQASEDGIYTDESDYTAL
jgi:hypothetical protein